MENRRKGRPNPTLPNHDPPDNQKLSTQKNHPKCSVPLGKKLAASLHGQHLPWKLIYSLVGTYLTSPKDEQFFQKIRHKSIFLRNNNTKATRKHCRVCRQTIESIQHLNRCNKLLKVRKLVWQLWEAMGCDRSNHDTDITFLFGITWPQGGDKPKPLSEAERRGALHLLEGHPQTPHPP